MKPILMSIIVAMLAWSSNACSVPDQSIFKTKLQGDDLVLLQQVNADFNGDGNDDIAMLVQYHGYLTINGMQYHSLDPMQGKQELLVIVTDIDVQKHQFFILHSPYNDRFVSPSFKLVTMKKTEIVPSEGDVLILPTESGIDELVYFNKNKVVYFVPQEEP